VGNCDPPLGHTVGRLKGACGYTAGRPASALEEEAMPRAYVVPGQPRCVVLRDLRVVSQIWERLDSGRLACPEHSHAVWTG